MSVYRSLQDIYATSYVADEYIDMLDNRKYLLYDSGAIYFFIAPVFNVIQHEGVNEIPEPLLTPIIQLLNELRGWGYAHHWVNNDDEEVFHVLDDDDEHSRTVSFVAFIDHNNDDYELTVELPQFEEHRRVVLTEEELRSILDFLLSKDIAIYDQYFDNPMRRYPKQPNEGDRARPKHW